MWDHFSKVLKKWALSESPSWKKHSKNYIICMVHLASGLLTLNTLIAKQLSQNCRKNFCSNETCRRLQQRGTPFFPWTPLLPSNKGAFMPRLQISSAKTAWFIRAASSETPEFSMKAQQPSKHPIKGDAPLSRIPSTIMSCGLQDSEPNE